MFLALPDQSDATNRHISVNLSFGAIRLAWEGQEHVYLASTGMFLALPDQSDATNRQISLRSIDWRHQIGLGGRLTRLARSWPLQCENQPLARTEAS